MPLSTIPEWFGAAVLGALITALGWLVKQFAEWRAGLAAEERRRRARLVELLALLRAGDVAFKVQCENRDRLAELIGDREPDLVDQPYDHMFQLAHQSMSAAERELFDVVRCITVHTVRPLNESLLTWLSSDTEFRVHPPDGTARARLAKYLADLEAHLLLWRAKYNAWIPEHPDRALVYLADEERHGVPFPHGGDELVLEILNQKG